ncbi:MAG: hypothetical protein L0170_06805, partial [Acidobacteria bacterium]|nr:hypothetical protein [Acidobacteriota bacterium]
MLLPGILLPLFGVSMVVAQQMITRDAFRFEYGGVSGQAIGDEYFRSTMAAFLGVAVLGYGAVFFLQGLLFSLYFREGREEGILSNVYGVDLLASGIGALIAGVLNFWITPVQMVALASLLFLINLWAFFRHLGLALRWVAAATLLTGLLVAAEGFGGFFSRLENPAWLPESANTVWSRYRRIDSVESPVDLQVYADGLRFQQHAKVENPYAQDARLLTARLVRDSEPPVEDMLIIGAGSGSDVRILRQAIPDRPIRIVAVELDEGFVRTARGFPWIWNDYSRADIRIQEGRYFLENSRQNFDFVLYSYIDPQSSVGSIGVPDAN